MYSTVVELCLEIILSKNSFVTVRLQNTSINTQKMRTIVFLAIAVGAPYPRKSN
ncbi:MAG: hypothetical protein QNJ51_09415 [Calothrix sp. MO_167.B12]|nr:hypothetical protein [Calothrix sp. MO_167.B12]